MAQCIFDLPLDFHNITMPPSFFEEKLCRQAVEATAASTATLSMKAATGRGF